MTLIRTAMRSEIEWINKCYDEVAFSHSNFDREVIAVAEVEGLKAGLGRIVTIDDDHLELGGIYVFENFRNQGIARDIVTFLLEHSNTSQTIYCIAVTHLLSFYKKFGFELCIDLESVHKKIYEKNTWCQENYPIPTKLLVCNPSFSHNLLLT